MRIRKRFLSNKTGTLIPSNRVSRHWQGINSDYTRETMFPMTRKGNMPNYKTHDTIGTGLAIVSGIATYSTQLLSFRDSVLLGIAIILGTLYLSPDLDTDSMIYRRWGILRWYWYPYKELIKHRSILSHSGPISATIRLLYLFCIPLILLLIFIPQFNRGDILYTIDMYLSSIAVIWAGAIIADTIHVIADITVSTLKGSYGR